jgi:hypothetical protein
MVPKKKKYCRPIMAFLVPYEYVAILPNPINLAKYRYYQ